MRLHTWKTELAVDLLEDEQLRLILSENPNALKSGAIFPDSGYVFDKAFGEASHWSEFLNAYYQELKISCPLLDTRWCRRVFAHFMGSLSHTIADINFDKFFVTEAARQDYSGDIDQAQSFLDTGLDFLAIKDEGRLFEFPLLRVPFDQLEATYARLPAELRPTRGDLFSSTQTLYLGFKLEPVGSLATYNYYKEAMPWASLNYLSANGGVEDTAQLIAQIWDKVWQQFPDDSKKDLFYEQGNWPEIEFYVDGMRSI